MVAASRYKFGRFTIESDLTLGLPTITGEDPDFVFLFPSVAPQSLEDCHIINRQRSADGRIWSVIKKCGAGFFVEFPEYASFGIDVSDNTIRCWPKESIPDATLEHLFLDQILPMVLAHQHQAALHASAVAHNSRVIVFIAPTGTGKSTMATSLTQSGLLLLTDDCLLVNKTEYGSYVATGNYPGVRLWSDSIEALGLQRNDTEFMSHYSHKKRLHRNPEGFSIDDGAMPINCIFLLTVSDHQTETSAVKICPLSFAESVVALIENSFRLDPTDRERNASEFTKLSCLATSVPMYRLSFLHRYDLLPIIRAAILSHVEATSHDG